LSSRSVALTVAVLFLSISLLGVRPTYASSTPSLLAVVRGTDNGVYYDVGNWIITSSFRFLSWSGWASLPGGTSSAPTLCTGEEGTGDADLVLRGTDNGIYHRAYASGSWSSSWDTPGGATNDQPACVEYNGFLYVVVRGTDNSLYFNSYNQGSKTWGSWVGLGGATNAPPTLVYEDYGGLTRLELFVRGTNNAIYHKGGRIGGTGAVTWASWASWDSLGGATPSAVTALWAGSSLPGYFLYGVVVVFVQGTDNGVYVNLMGLPGNIYTFSGWYDGLGGATSMAMGADGPVGGYDPLIVVGTDNALYGADFDFCPSSGPCYLLTTDSYFTQIYASAGGTVTSPPAVTYGYPGAPNDVDVLVAGVGGGLYFNIFNPAGTPPTAWVGYVGLGGSTPSTPAITNLSTAY
jgi:hypothetical protein